MIRTTSRGWWANRNAVFSRLFGNNIVRAREVVAAWLIRLRVRPNTLTIMGLGATLVAAVFLALGAGDKIGSSSLAGHSWYGLWAGVWLIIAAAFDILDGAVAQKNNQVSRQGAFLDSCMDRIADGAIFTGIIIYYLQHGETAHNCFFIAAAAVALVNAELISYVKARAECFVPACPVGYWQRGERIAAILIGLFCGHVATVMVMLATLAGLTVIRRLTFAARQIRRLDENRPLLQAGPATKGIMRLALWRHRRGSLPYDIVTAINIAMILLIDLQRS